MDNRKIASISISGEITLNLHALNNEGGEGNQIITRQVTIVDKTGTKHTVNGISGDMFKHIHAAHLTNYAVENGLPLSTLAEKGNPNRISNTELNTKITKQAAEQSDVVKAMLETCTVTDIHGVLMTDNVKGKSNTPRKSVIEFGWTVGIPNKVGTETFFHTKIAPDENPTPFNRPANHGAYAFVCHLEAFRIGFNDMDRTYSAVDAANRKKRYQATIMSLISSFLNPRGAMSSMQKPHITDFKGIVSVSYSTIPAPTVSALNDGFEKEIKAIGESLNKISANSIEIKEFKGLAAFVEILKDLSNETPFELSKPANS